MIDTLWFLFARQFVRNQIVMAATMFKAVCYYEPDQCQIITTGEDRKVSDGQALCWAINCARVCRSLYSNPHFSYFTTTQSPGAGFIKLS